MTRTPSAGKANGKAGPQLKPHNLEGGQAWWYEDERGISVHIWRGNASVQSVSIPWKRLRLSAESTPDTRRARESLCGGRPAGGS